MLRRRRWQLRRGKLDVVYVLALRRAELHVIQPERSNGRAGFPYPAFPVFQACGSREANQRIRGGHFQEPMVGMRTLTRRSARPFPHDIW